MNLLTTSVFDVQIPEYNWAENEPTAFKSDQVYSETPEGKYEHNSMNYFGDETAKLSKKRKSVEIVGNERWERESKYEPLPFQGFSDYSSDLGGDLPVLRELFVDDVEKDISQDRMTQFKSAKVDNKLLFPRKSEDWDSKPLQQKPTFADFMQKKRQKWTQSELKMLWTSIAVHGNNWSLVNDILTSRSYYQIKDKGRRVLYEHGWTTGRNKKDSEIANRDAKVIAQKLVEGTAWLRS